MPARTFDDPVVRSAMADLVKAAGALDEAAHVGGQPRELVDLAEAKAMAAMRLTKRLTDLGWTAPATSRV